MPAEHLADSLPPWLNPHWMRLQAAQRAQRLPHALLIVGARGLGKRELAEQLARALICRTPQANGQGCGLCPDCHLFAAGHHPDLLRVGPDPGSKSGEIPIAAIRSFQEREALTPSRAARKVVLIDPADRLNTAAANALLKTLEEPPGQSLLCLIAEHGARLPATIRSRCQQIRLATPPEAEALNWLAASGIARAEAQVRLRLAHGAPLGARDGIDAEQLSARAPFLDALLALVRGERDPLREAATWNQLGLALSLDWLLSVLCDLVRLAATPNPPRLEYPDQREILLGLVQRLDLDDAHQLLRRVLQARALSDSTLNAQLLLESLAIEWTGLLRRRS